MIFSDRTKSLLQLGYTMYTLNRSNLRQINVELETIRFRPEQVMDYVNNPQIVSVDTAKDINSFLAEHLLVQGLVRIPIQLDALCYSWSSNFRKDAPKTVTGIY